MRAYSSSLSPRAPYGCSFSGVAIAFSTESGTCWGEGAGAVVTRTPKEGAGGACSVYRRGRRRSLVRAVARRRGGKAAASWQLGEAQALCACCGRQLTVEGEERSDHVAEFERGGEVESIQSAEP